ncbi:MAG: hypothetical protein NVS2B7_00880 [Herpetosiphon sp.]
MRTSRDAIRRAVAGLSDSDLDRPIWSPLPGMGWMILGSGVEWCLAHTWNHIMELRLRLKQPTPAPKPAATHIALARYLGFFPLTVNRSLAAKTTFTATLELTGAGGGCWTIRVSDGVCSITEERVPKAALIVTQSIATFQATLIGAQHPMLALVTGKVKLQRLRNMSTFGKLFPPPKPDTLFLAPAAQHTAPTLV